MYDMSISKTLTIYKKKIITFVINSSFKSSISVNIEVQSRYWAYTDVEYSEVSFIFCSLEDMNLNNQRCEA